MRRIICSCADSLAIAEALAGGLALRKLHWAARVAEVGVAYILEEGQQLLYLLRRSRWA
jgi:hypothetical protein